MRYNFFRKNPIVVRSSPWDILDKLSLEGNLTFRFNKDQVYIFQGSHKIGQGTSFIEAVSTIDMSCKHFCS